MLLFFLNPSLSFFVSKYFFYHDQIYAFDCKWQQQQVREGWYGAPQTGRVQRPGPLHIRC